MNRITEAVKHLIIINVVVFIATYVLKMGFSDSLALYFPENENFGFWQFLTHMFVHGGVMHIVFNMYALWAFGSPLEQMWGRNKFLFFYFSAGLGAGLIYTAVNYFQFNNAMETLLISGATKSEIFDLINPALAYQNEALQTVNEIFTRPAVGASGAVYGVLVAFGMTFPNAKLALIFFPVPISAKYFIPLIILGDLFFGITGAATGVAHFAHIGGAIIGFIIAMYWKKNQFKRWN
ncbi:MAG: rhomboid family intramembrane serine protease [Urechidicola sp.]|nr:rhomboid family intramembrane serine protease [Urechidicola sp.]